MLVMKFLSSATSAVSSIMWTGRIQRLPRRRGNPLAFLGRELLIIDKCNHLNSRRTQHNHDESARPVCKQVRCRVVDDSGALFSERLSRLDWIRCITVELEQHLYLEHVAEISAGVTV